MNKIGFEEYNTLKSMMESKDDIGLALNIIRNADREDPCTEFWIICLGNMYVPGHPHYNPNARILQLRDDTF